SQGSTDVGVSRLIADPSHYRKLRETDGDSFKLISKSLESISRPIKSIHKEKMNELLAWFMRLVNFFFLFRPSGEKIQFNLLSKDEQDRFTLFFTKGAGRLFQNHCVTVAKETINCGRNIYPNDLYDLMQLILLHNENLLFVTDDKFFYKYQLDAEIQRVLPWVSMRSSGES
ncbi:MAG TPA: hypothetical protein VI489_03565, partial [Candidatus Brocadiaceae bacterium]